MLPILLEEEQVTLYTDAQDMMILKIGSTNLVVIGVKQSHTTNHFLDWQEDIPLLLVSLAPR